MVSSTSAAMDVRYCPFPSRTSNRALGGERRFVRHSMVERIERRSRPVRVPLWRRACRALIAADKAPRR
jgi:hypothetical protein